MWEIIDNNGVIHSGSEEEMRLAFGAMTIDDGSVSFTNADIEQFLTRKQKEKL